MLSKIALKLHRLVGQQYGKLDWAGGNIQLALDSTTDLQRLSSCKKEPETVTWLEQTLRPHDVFFDVGANVGAYSLIAAKLLETKGQVFSFEPGFANFATLSKNAIQNEVTKTLIPIQIALSDAPGFLHMCFSTLDSGGAKHTVSKEYRSNLNVISVPSMRLDDFVHEYHTPLPTVLKIDVDGGEWGVVQGARKTLASSSLRSLLIEIDFREPTSTEVVALIERMGLQLSAKYPREKGKSEHLFNMIFSRAQI